MATELFENVPSTTVTAGGTTAPVSGTPETWTVASSASFPAASATAGTQFHVADPAATGESVLVTNVSGTTWTVTRGAESTVPVVHAPGFTVVQVITAGTLGSFPQYLSAVAFGADPGGTADSTAAINAALAAVPAGGGIVWLPAGTYLLNGSSGLSLSVAGTKLLGAGTAATTIKMGGSFSAAQAVSVAADSCTIGDLSFAGNTVTVTANPAATAIEMSGGWQHCKFRNLFFQYVNGWCVESVAGASRANLDTMISSLVMRNCAAGIRVLGVTGSSFSAEHFLSDIQAQQMGAASGTFANLDALRMEDCQDVLTGNLNVGIVAGTGSAVHVTGACASCFLVNADVGGGTGTVLIEDGANGSPSSIQFSNGTIQQSTAGPGLKVTGAAGDLQFDHIQFHRNFTDGVAASNSGAASQLTDCRWNTNNQAAGTAYDLNLASASGKWFVNGGVFNTAVGSATAGKVVNPVNDPAAAGWFEGVSFLGTGTTAANLAPGGQSLALWFCTVTTAQGIGPMTTLGDVIYGSASGAAVRLAGNTTGQKEFLQSLGSAGTATAPSWATVPGQFLCAPSSYPGTGAQTLFTSTSGTMAAVSSANVNTGSFTAPASGDVLVEADFIMQAAPSGNAVAFGLAAHGSVSPMTGSDLVWKEPVTTQPFPHVIKSFVTGLTPGTAYNLDLMFAVAAGGTVTVFANNQSGTAPSLSNAGIGAPVLMTVQAV